MLIFDAIFMCLAYLKTKHKVGINLYKLGSYITVYFISEYHLLFVAV